MLVYLIHMYMCLFHYKIGGERNAQPICLGSHIVHTLNYPQYPLEGSCAPKIPSISIKLNYTTNQSQARSLQKSLKKTATNILISMCMCHVGSRWYTPDLKSHHSDLSICFIVATRLVSWNRRNRCQTSNQKARACFMSRCCISLPARYFLKSTNRKKSQSTMLPTGLVTGYSTKAAKL